MLKIWGRNNSSNVRKVIWTLEELGVPYERIDAGGAFGIVDEPSYRALNPNGLVPCLEDGDLVLWESNTIVRYLGARYGAEPFYAADPAMRAGGDKWMDWANSTFFPIFRDVFITLVRTPPEKRDQTLLENAIRKTAGVLAIPEAVLAGQPYLSGSEPGIGDVPLGALAYPWFELPIERPPTPNLDAWYARLRERSAYRKGVLTPLT